MFDQRMLRPSSDHFYFQLAPKVLIIQDKALARELKTSNTEFKLKLQKGTQNCDEMKSGVALTNPNGRVIFEKAQLNFYLPSFNPNRDVEFTLMLFQNAEGSESVEVGRFALMSSQYIKQFKDNQRKAYSESISFGDKYQLNCDIYIDGTRFGLEKFVRELKEGKISGREVEAGNLETSHNKTKSDALSGSSKGKIVSSGEDRFMSPSRKIVRKQGDRKLLMRNSSPQKSQGEGSQTSSQRARDLKFLGKLDSPRKPSPPQKMSLAEEEVKNIEARKRQTARQQALKKKEQDEQKRRQDLVKQTAKKEAENKRIEAQRRKEEDQARRAEEQEQKKKQIDRIAKDQQRRRKQEEAHKIRQQRAKKEEEEATRRILQTSGGSRGINRAQAPTSHEESRISRHSRDASSGNLNTKKSNQNSFTSKKSQKKAQQKQQLNIDDILSSTKKPIKGDFNWNDPVTIRRTDSGIFDQKGNLIRSSVLSHKGKKNQAMDMRTKVFLIVFMLISTLLMINAMRPSRKF